MKKADKAFEKSDNKSSDFKKYISEQEELNSVLNRVVGIYNNYRDERSTL